MSDEDHGHREDKEAIAQALRNEKLEHRGYRIWLIRSVPRMTTRSPSATPPAMARCVASTGTVRTGRGSKRSESLCSHTIDSPLAARATASRLTTRPLTADPPFLATTVIGCPTLIFGGGSVIAKCSTTAWFCSVRLVPFEGFKTQTGMIVIAAANDRLFATLAKTLDHPEWASDPRFRTNADRHAHKAILLAEIEQTLQTRPQSEWL